MKKKMSQKLVLNKKTISNLKPHEMNLIIGATVIDPYYCSRSCSVMIYCCGPTTEPKLEMIALTLPGYCR